MLQSLCLFLMHTPKGWIPVNMFTNPISVSIWPLHTIFDNSTKYESNDIPSYPTYSPSTQAKTQTVVQSLYVLPSTNSERMDSSPYVYRPNISLLLAILYYTLWFHQTRINEIKDPIKTSRTPTKTQKMLQSLHVLPNAYS
jgi:hypothetical protein